MLALHISVCVCVCVGMKSMQVTGVPFITELGSQGTAGDKGFLRGH